MGMGLPTVGLWPLVWVSDTERDKQREKTSAYVCGGDRIFSFTTVVYLFY